MVFSKHRTILLLLLIASISATTLAYHGDYERVIKEGQEQATCVFKKVRFFTIVSPPSIYEAVAVTKRRTVSLNRIFEDSASAQKISILFKGEGGIGSCSEASLLVKELLRLQYDYRLIESEADIQEVINTYQTQILSTESTIAALAKEDSTFQGQYECVKTKSFLMDSLTRTMGLCSTCKSVSRDIPYRLSFIVFCKPHPNDTRGYNPCNPTYSFNFVKVTLGLDLNGNVTLFDRFRLCHLQNLVTI